MSTSRGKSYSTNGSPSLDAIIYITGSNPLPTASCKRLEEEQRWLTPHVAYLQPLHLNPLSLHSAFLQPPEQADVSLG